MTAIWLRVVAILTTFLAVLLVLFGFYRKGHEVATAAANKDREHDEARRQAAGAQGVRDAQNKVDRMDAGVALDQLQHDWLRDDGSK